MNQINVNEVMNNVLQMDDLFEFQCDCCGKCCEFRNDIILSPIDLQRIAHYFERDIPYIVHRYCNVYIGNDSKLPVITLKSVGRKQSCPFLVKKKCSINCVKPTVCRLFPLGRVKMVSEDESESKMQYFIQYIECGKKD